ncbi:MAG TPA: hypothetical protein VI981_01790 [Candidatus Paceibacterota bacterium]
MKIILSLLVSVIATSFVLATATVILQASIRSDVSNAKLMTKSGWSPGLERARAAEPLERALESK